MGENNVGPCSSSNKRGKMVVWIITSYSLSVVLLLALLAPSFVSCSFSKKRVVCIQVRELFGEASEEEEDFLP